MGNKIGIDIIGDFFGGDFFGIDEFIESVNSGYINNSDGWGYYSDKEHIYGVVELNNIQRNHEYILWFNK